MSLSDEILKRTRLPKPTSQTTFVAIIPSDDDSRSSSRSSTRSLRTRSYKTKNANLYDQDECASQPLYSDTANEYEINESIRETNGGSASSVDIENRWKLRVKENREKELVKQKELDRMRAIEEIENERHQKAEEAKKKRLKRKQEEKENVMLDNETDGPKETQESIEAIRKNKNLFRNNALMRGLMEQKMANLRLTTENGKDTDTDENNKNSTNTSNGPVLVQSVEDPDFFFLRDTTSRNFNNVDNYRFEFRGTKQVVTPRQYALYEISDEDFEFKRKSS